MDKDTRNAIERATQRARKLLEEDFSSQLEGTFDVVRSGTVAAKGGAHLSARQGFQRDKIVAAIAHKRAAGMTAAEAVTDYVRDAAFTTLNRFVALKMLEARELAQECISKGDQSVGYREFCGMAPGVALLPDAAGYRLYIESLFDELSTEVKVLFDRRDAASVLWPKRQPFEALLDLLNTSELGGVWGQDETIGWVYQFFNSGEERKKMREESQAPRNSRELAVRNQFFTPRYVVQFLTDNTLGRIWYEMRGGETVLGSRCKYLVRRQGETYAPRVKKDPRDLRVLDPACGSGHFLLYAFDLLIAIYEEAHIDPDGPKSEVTGKTLAADYPSIDALRQALPTLVLACNLHGVDIDPRCAQIAQLALWMRAQRAFRDFGVARAERPLIRRSNIVVAEPLVTDDGTTREFLEKLGDVELGRVFTDLVENLKLAGDLGLLLHIERLIAPGPKRGQTGDLFAPPEARIRAALASFVAAASALASTRRRLFADDAEQGVGLLETAEKKFDIVVMNPPFGAGSLTAKKEFEKGYPRTKNDIYAAFIERGITLLHSRGLLGAITSRTGFFLPSFQLWREEVLLKDAPPVVVADLGLGVMDAALVEAAAYCLERIPVTDRSVTTFLRVLEEPRDKNTALLKAIQSTETAIGRQRFEVNVTRFSAVPRSPFAYWVSDRLRALFSDLPLFETSGRTAKVGLQTSDDFRFVRCWWAVPPMELGSRWFLFAKGGHFSPFYADVYLVVNWERDGREIANFCLPGSDRVASRPQNVEFYFRPGLTWPHRTKSEMAFRVLPAGCAFGHKGPSAFVDGDAEDELLSLLAICRSKGYRALSEFQLAAAEPTGRGGAARSYDVGVLQRTPVPRLSAAQRSDLVRLAHLAWSLKRMIDEVTETSHAFTLPALLQVSGDDVPARAKAWSQRLFQVESQLARVQATIDEQCFTLYDIDETDRGAITQGFGNTSDSKPMEEAGESEDCDDEDGDDASATPEGVSLAADLVSWAFGVAIGRFDVRLATKARPLPTAPKPFDPLPRCSPGMLTGADGLPIARPPAGYPIVFPSSGVLVDDPGHERDVTTAVRIVFDVVFGANSERWWEKVTGLHAKGHDLRAWLANCFFDHHLKRYSKSRRKAPIFWQFGTPSGRYSVWLYAHCLTRDSLFQLQNQSDGVLAQKLTHEERRLTALIQNAGAGPSARDRREIAEQEAAVDELRAFLDETRRVAPLWNPHLDDGVVVTMAPLWRLVPQHKAWQKELKRTWDELVAGENEWARLAMHLWAERVVPKCATDRSLAIAHGLEDAFWVEGADGKWKARTNPLRPVDELVRERSSPAVKAALRSLLDAPTALVTVRGRGRRGPSAAATG